MKILITGAAGFIGSNLAQRLAEMGHDVTGIDNFSDYYPVALKEKNVHAITSSGVRFSIADLRNTPDFDALPTTFHYIFHLAAQPGISSATSFEDYLSNNLIATRNLSEFALTNPDLKLFVNISTSSVYGGDATQDESIAPMPISWYGVTKLAAEQIVLSQARNGKYNACSLRLYSVYGPRERPDKLYSRLIECGLSGTRFPLYEGSLEHSRSFTFVGDIVDGIVSVIGKEDLLNLEIVNLGSDVEHTTAEGIAIVERLVGKTIGIEMFPARAGDQSKTRAIISKARKLLDYAPSTTLEKGIAQQLAWFKETF